MPIYEYECSHCDIKFEKLQSFSASKTCTCPDCGGTADRRISLGSFILKGTGWYVTDHPSSSRQKGMREQSHKPKSKPPEKTVEKPESKTTASTTNSTKSTKSD